MYFIKKDLNEFEDRQLYLGAFIRVERENENMTLGFMADIVGITKSFLSDIEHGKKMPSEYTLNRIMDVLGVSFNSDYSFRFQIIEQLENMYLLYTELNKEKMNTIIQDINLNYDNYYNSYAFITCDILRLVFYLTIEDDIEISKKLINKIDSFVHLLSKEELTIYYDMKGLYYYKNNDLENAQDLFTKGLEQASAPCTIGMICYHLALLNQRKNNQIDSLIYCERAIQQFSRNFNIFRLLYLELYKGTCYSRERIYDKAIAIYQKVIDNSIKNNYERITNVAYNNIAWTYLKSKDYNEVIKYTEMSFELNPNPSFVELYTYIPYSYYKLGNYQLSLNAISIYKRKLKNSIHLYFLDAIEAKIKKDDKLFLECIKKYITILFSGEKDIDMLYFVYEELIEFYKKENNFYELSKIYAELIKLYENT